MGDEQAHRFETLQCHRCGTLTKHQHADDAWWCVRCWKAGVYDQVAEDHANGGGIMMGTIKFAGFLIALVVIVSFATCAYVCVGTGH